MKEFIEKLIGRLEEQKEQYKRARENTHCVITETSECDSCRADHYLYARLRCIDRTIEIVNQLAEEYKDKEVLDMAQVSADYAKARLEEIKRISDNGWIPASEPPKYFMLSDGRLIPFLVCDKLMWHPYIAFYNGKEWCTALEKLNPTAYMPLPPAYVPEERSV